MCSLLGRFLNDAAGSRFAWGTADCLIWPADWVLTLSGRDPAAGYRGRYRTELGAARLLKRAGGLLAVAGAGMASVGAVTVTEPLQGDVGVIMGMTERGPAPGGGIYDGRRWVLRTARGILAIQAEPLAAWSTEFR